MFTESHYIMLQSIYNVPSNIKQLYIPLSFARLSIGKYIVNCHLFYQCGVSTVKRNANTSHNALYNALDTYISSARLGKFLGIKHKFNQTNNKLFTHIFYGQTKYTEFMFNDSLQKTDII